MLDFGEVIELRKVIADFVRGRDWMKRNFEVASDKDKERFEEKCEKPFDEAWKKFKDKMSDEQRKKFLDLLNRETVAPHSDRSEFEVEPRPSTMKDDKGVASKTPKPDLGQMDLF